MSKFKVDTRYAMLGKYIEAEGPTGAAKAVQAKLRKSGNTSMTKVFRERKEFADCAVTDSYGRTTYFRIT